MSPQPGQSNEGEGARPISWQIADQARKLNCPFSILYHNFSSLRKKDNVPGSQRGLDEARALTDRVDTRGADTREERRACIFTNVVQEVGEPGDKSWIGPERENEPRAHV
jgi:hypothetical protein